MGHSTGRDNEREMPRDLRALAGREAGKRWGREGKQLRGRIDAGYSDYGCGYAHWCGSCKCIVCLLAILKSLVVGRGEERTYGNEGWARCGANGPEKRSSGAARAYAGCSC